MFCGNCGTENEAEFKFCKKCGNNLAQQGGMPQYQGGIDIDPAFRDYLKQRFQLKPEEGILAVGKHNPKLKRGFEIFECIIFSCVVVFFFGFSMLCFKESSEESGSFLLGLMFMLLGVGELKALHFSVFCPSKAKREQLLVVTTERVIGIGFLAEEKKGFYRISGGGFTSFPTMVPINASFDFLLKIVDAKTPIGVSQKALHITTKSGYIGFYAIENREEMIDVVQREMLRCKSQ